MTRGQSNFIKVMAMLTMLIDHVGMLLYPEIELLRIIGRIAFPLFALQIGVGYRYTRSVTKYFLRLVIFGALLQGAYLFAYYVLRVDADPFMLNIFFTLAAGLLAIVFIERRLYALFALLIAAAAAMDIANGVIFMYGAYGIMMIAMLYVFFHSPLLTSLSLIGLTALHSFFGGGVNVQLFAVLALPFMLSGLELKINIPSWFFYLFYPLHLAALQGIAYLMYYS